ncbi:MAG: DegT/DnrJ/EryC1/StrS family aminotransferase, partial [Planctomycetaceae bacterium]
MNKHFIKFAPPSIGQKEIDEVVDTLRSDWITTGPKTRRFEVEFANYLGGRAALALNSCTAGLHTALMALGVGRGDEVITTPMTFAASVNVIEHVGATPVLVDVEPDTLNLDPARVEAAITPRTRVILPVHFAGHPV